MSIYTSIVDTVLDKSKIYARVIATNQYDPNWSHRFHISVIISERENQREDWCSCEHTERAAVSTMSVHDLCVQNPSAAPSLPQVLLDLVRIVIQHKPPRTASFDPFCQRQTSSRIWPLDHCWLDSFHLNFTSRAELCDECAVTA